MPGLMGGLESVTVSATDTAGSLLVNNLLAGLLFSLSLRLQLGTRTN